MNTLPDFSPFTSSFTGSGPSVGVVMSHGFTGSPHSMRPWARYLAEEGFDVVLLDLTMPRLDGVQALERMKDIHAKDDLLQGAIHHRAKARCE